MRRLPVWEFYQHIVLQRRRRGGHYNWLLSTAVFADMEKSGREQIASRLRDMLQFGQKSASPFEMCDNEQGRLEMVGLVAIKSGAEFSTRFAGHARWLRQHGYTVEQAIAAQQASAERERQNPFWQENR
jgi:hypothetical protein